MIKKDDLSTIDASSQRVITQEKTQVDESIDRALRHALPGGYRTRRHLSSRLYRPGPDPLHVRGRCRNQYLWRPPPGSVDQSAIQH